MRLGNKCENHFVNYKVRWNVTGESRSQLDTKSYWALWSQLLPLFSFSVHHLLLAETPFLHYMCLCGASALTSAWHIWLSLGQTVFVSWELGSCADRHPGIEGHWSGGSVQGSLPAPELNILANLFPALSQTWTFSFPFQSVSCPIVFQKTPFFFCLS